MIRKLLYLPVKLLLKIVLFPFKLALNVVIKTVTIFLSLVLVAALIAGVLMYIGAVPEPSVIADTVDNVSAHTGNISDYVDDTQEILNIVD